MPDSVMWKFLTAADLQAVRYRSFRDITPSGVIGDARRASPQKGEKLMATCRDGIAAVLPNPETWS